MPSLPAVSRVSSLLFVTLLAGACGNDDDPGAPQDEIGDPDVGDPDVGDPDVDPDPDPDPEAQIACEEQVIIIDGLDAENASGLLAADLLDPLVGDYDGQLQWLPQDGDIKVDVKPLAAQVELSLALAYSGGELRFVESLPNEAAVAAGAEAELDCRSRMEADVLLGFRTDDGAFEEELTVNLQADIVDGAFADAVVRHELDLEALQGNLAIDSIEPAEPAAMAVVLEALFMTDPDTQAVTSKGALGGWADYIDGEGEQATVSHGEFLIANW